MQQEAAVGIIGLGLMGSALSGRMIEAGIAVIGFDVDPERCNSLKGRLTRIAASAADLASQSRAIVIAVYDGAEAEALLDDLQESPARPVLICTTTCAPDEILRVAARAANAGFTFVEAPISGTSAEVRDGTATTLIAGETAAVEAVGDLLDVLCPHRTRLGKIGDASRAKLAINLILQNNRAAMAEGLVFAESLGLDPRVFLAIARQSAAYSAVMDSKGEKMLTRDFTPQSHISQTLKDAELILDEAELRDLQLPVTSAQASLLRATIARRGGECDSSAIIETIAASRAQGEKPA